MPTWREPSPPTPKGPSTWSPSTSKAAARDAEAKQVAKTIADSALVKTAIFGADPNWGRFVSAAGYAGVAFEEKDLSLWMGDMLLYRAGTPLPFDAKAAVDYLKNEPRSSPSLAVHARHGRCTFYTCDLTTIRAAERGLHDVMPLAA